MCAAQNEKRRENKEEANSKKRINTVEMKADRLLNEQKLFFFRFCLSTHIEVWCFRETMRKDANTQHIRKAYLQVEKKNCFNEQEDTQHGRSLLLYFVVKLQAFFVVVKSFRYADIRIDRIKIYV